MKLLILGHGGHGKDTIAEFLNQGFGITFKSSSKAASEKVVFPALKKVYGYKTATECFDDRRNHREEWKRLIADYNTPDKGRLCREILSEVDCYDGMRCELEYEATRNLFDVIIWVDASERVGSDPTMTIKRQPYMACIDNNGSIGDTYRQVADLFPSMGLKE